MASFSYLTPAFEGIHPAWIPILLSKRLEPLLKHIDTELYQQFSLEKRIYPQASDIFKALRFVSPEDIKVVILGQDPYHGVGEAMGLSFSVPPAIRIPPSLRNIYKEQVSDLNISSPNNGDLTHWAQQGVLLLNSVLTVEADQAGSHAKLGWQTVSDELIDAVNRLNPACVFMLWGNWAKLKAERIDSARHLILSAAHPSPLSANRGFHGCKHFSQANQWLMEKRHAAINWSAPLQQSQLF
jgi:uracil-DNA glycosylase